MSKIMEPLHFLFHERLNSLPLEKTTPTPSCVQLGAGFLRFEASVPFALGKYYSQCQTAGSEKLTTKLYSPKLRTKQELFFVREVFTIFVHACIIINPLTRV
jgi:hypothetical protein